jgi:starvation-inducible DNA-binding protein
MFIKDKTLMSVAGAAKSVMATKLKEDVEVQKAGLVAMADKALNDLFGVYLKAHTYHLNIDGANFPQYHELFKKVYDGLYDSVDPHAEHIRILGGYVMLSPATLARKSSVVEDTSAMLEPRVMLSNLNDELSKLVRSLKALYAAAEAANEIGFSNFLQAKIEEFGKLNWMVATTLKGV